MTWQDNLHSVGIPEIDDQHKQLFLLTNQFFELRKTPPSADRQRRVASLVKQLYAFTKYEFATEESIFDHYGYPESPNHRKAHSVFTKQILAELSSSKEAAYDLGPLSDALVDWILNHVTKDDRLFADYYRGKGITVDAHFSHEAAKGADSSIRSDARTIWYEKKLSLDIAAIDHQHQELVLILQQANDLQRATRERKLAFLPGIIQKLIHYSEFHFLFEEELMSRHNYPAIADHQQQHAGYIRKIQEFAHELTAGNPDLNDEIILFLKQWIVDHILLEDKDFKVQCQETLAHEGKT